MYLLSSVEDEFIGPQRLEWTNSNAFFAFHDFPYRNWLQCCLLATHSSQTYWEHSIWENPITIFFYYNPMRPPKFRCPKQKCQIHDVTSFTLVDKHILVVLWRFKGNIQLVIMLTWVVKPLFESWIWKIHSLMMILYPFSWSCSILSKFVFNLE